MFGCFEQSYVIHIIRVLQNPGRKMPVSIRLPKDIEERLNRLAALTGRTKSYYLRELIMRGLDELEDYYLAASVLERIRKGEEKTYSLEEVERELGLED